MYRSQIFILPKKIVKVIEAICRQYLWTSNTNVSKRALIAWERLSYPICAGGLNLTDMQSWNRAAICKLLWNLCAKKDKLWVAWIHNYYIKGGSIWDAQCKATILDHS